MALNHDPAEPVDKVFHELDVFYDGSLLIGFVLFRAHSNLDTEIDKLGDAVVRLAMLERDRVGPQRIVEPPYRVEKRDSVKTWWRMLA